MGFLQHLLGHVVDDTLRNALFYGFQGNFSTYFHLFFFYLVFYINGALV